MVLAEYIEKINLSLNFVFWPHLSQTFFFFERSWKVSVLCEFCLEILFRIKMIDAAGQSMK